MNKIIFKLAIACVLTFSTTWAFAEGAWTSWHTVETVYLVGNGDNDIYVRFAPYSQHINPGGCASNTWYRVLSTNEQVKFIYQMLLTSKASGATVRGYVIGCKESYPVLRHVMIQ
ncbi:MAG: hypothetical protein ACRBHB_10345 [Arenicella sp.]